MGILVLISSRGNANLCKSSYEVGRKIKSLFTGYQKSALACCRHCYTASLFFYSYRQYLHRVSEIHGYFFRITARRLEMDLAIRLPLLQSINWSLPPPTASSQIIARQIMQGNRTLPEAALLTKQTRLFDLSPSSLPECISLVLAVLILLPFCLCFSCLSTTIVDFLVRVGRSGLVVSALYSSLGHLY